MTQMSRQHDIEVVAEPDGGPASEQEPLIVDSLKRVHLFDLDFVNEDSIATVIAEILSGAKLLDAEGRQKVDVLPLVLTPNVDILVRLSEKGATVEREMFARAQFCLPDGQPVVLASRLLGRPLASRLAGSDLFAQLWPRIVSEQISVVVVASSEDLADRLFAEGANASYVVPPVFDGNDKVAVGEVADEIIEVCRHQEPQLLLVGVGHPKDARVLAAVFDRWPLELGEPPVSMGLGGSFAMYLGLLRRAPVLLQRLSLEWFYRFCQEPRRLFRRYFIEDLAFIPLVIKERKKIQSEGQGAT